MMKMIRMILYIEAVTGKRLIDYITIVTESAGRYGGDGRVSERRGDRG